MAAEDAAGCVRHDRDLHAVHAMLPHPRVDRAAKSQGADLDGEVIRVGRLSLDLRRLVADAGGGQVPLTRLEFLLLRELALHPDRPVPKARLLAAVWGYDFDPGSNVVDVCVRRLRSKFGFDLIETVRGEGYQLAG